MEFLAFIKDLLVIISTSCAVITFIIWKRQVVLNRKIAVLESLYRNFLSLQDTIVSIYTPWPFCFKIEDIDIYNDKDLKERIKKYRYECLSKNVKVYYEILSEEKIVNKYLKLDKFFEDFKFAWINTHIAADPSYVNSLTELDKYECLDESFLHLYRNQNYDKSYENFVLEKFKSLNAILENELDKLLA